MSQRSHIAISGRTAIWECSAACSAPSSACSGELAHLLLRQLVPERLRDEVLLGQVERLEVDHLVVGHALALEGDHLLHHGHDPEPQRHAERVALLARLLDEGLGLDLGLRVLVALGGAHDRAALVDVEVLDLVGLAQVQVDRAGMDGGERPLGLDEADQLAAVGVRRS